MVIPSLFYTPAPDQHGSLGVSDLKTHSLPMLPYVCASNQH